MRALDEQTEAIARPVGSAQPGCHDRFGQGISTTATRKQKPDDLSKTNHHYSPHRRLNFPTNWRDVATEIAKLMLVGFICA